MSRQHPGRLHAVFSSSTKENELMIADACERQAPSRRAELECERELWGPGPSLTETGFLTA